MNNDTPGTDDGKGGGYYAYGPDMRVGNPVVRGQLIGYVGDSGNAENTVPHCHFEMFNPHGDVINPYKSLNAAKHIKSPVYPPALPNELLPYTPHSKIGLNIAMGNFDLDPAAELVSGAGAGGSPIVKVFNNDDSVMNSFYSHSSTFKGGVDVAAGDVDGDGQAEIITGTGPGTASRVKVFERDGTQLANFVVNRTDYLGGIKVAAGDVDGDGRAEIITANGKGTGPRIKVWELNGHKDAEFLVFSSSFNGGVDVASADVAGGIADEIIAGAGPGRATHVTTWQLDGTKLGDFIAYDSSYKGGVRVSAANVRTSSLKSEILTVPWTKGEPRERMYRYTGSYVAGLVFIESWWRGPYDVAAGFNANRTGVGINRRASIRAGVE